METVVSSAGAAAAGASVAAAAASVATGAAVAAAAGSSAAGAAGASVALGAQAVRRIPTIIMIDRRVERFFFIFFLLTFII
jgi:hypothetical protein